MQDQDEQHTDKIRPVSEQTTEESSQAVSPISVVPPSPSESFGSFDMPAATMLIDPYAYPQNQSGQEPLAAPSVPISPYSYVPGQPMPPYVSMLKAKAPLYFPLMRQVPTPRQFFDMFLYSVFMAFSIMGVLLYLLNAYNSRSSVFVTSDGSSNGLSILLTFVLVLLVIPACSLLCGALFGSWRGLLVSLVSIGGGLFITHLINSQFGSGRGFASALPLLGLPIAALVVGLIYERRTYAAWWKSMFTLMLGAAIASIWFVTSILVTEAGAANLAAQASPHPQAFIVGLWIGGAIFSLVGILALTFPIASIEGLIHWCVAVEKKR